MQEEPQTNTDQAAIISEAAPANDAISQQVGQPDGTEVVNVAGESTGERVVYEYNDPNDKTVITGWHKESLNG